MRNKRVLALLLVVMLVPSVGLGARGFFRWWLAPPADPVEDVIFDATTRRAVYLEIQVSDTGVDSWKRIKFGEAPVPASVASGILTIGEINLESENGDTAKISFVPPEDEPEGTELNESFFGSYFRMEGNAIVFLAPDEGTEEPPVPAIATEIRVTIAGSITERRGDYRLRARIFGYERTEEVGDEEVTSITYNVIRMGVKGTPETEESAAPEESEPVEPAPV